MKTEKVHRFGVEGMTCRGCEESLEKALARIPGISSVQASHLDRSVIVTLSKEDDLLLTQVRSTVAQAGFKVTKG